MRQTPDGIGLNAVLTELQVANLGRMPSDFQLNGLALFGFCREAIRRRVKPLVQCFCKRKDEE